MNYPSTKTLPESKVYSRLSPNALLTKMESLRERLDTFTVVAQGGEAVGEVRNLTLANQELHLVIVQPDARRGWRFLQLSSRLVQRVSTRDRTVFVRASLADISYLPEYRVTPHAHVDRPSAKPPAPVKHLPSQNGTRPKAVDGSTASEGGTEPVPKKTTVPFLEHPATPKILSDVADFATAPTGSVQSPPDRLTDEPLFPVSRPVLDADRDPTRSPVSVSLSSAQRGTTSEASHTDQAVALLEPPVNTSAAISSNPAQPPLQPNVQNGAVRDARAVTNDGSVVRGAFVSPRRASQVLDAIANTINHRCKAIRIEIELEDGTLRDVYQEWLAQYSQSPKC